MCARACDSCLLQKLKGLKILRLMRLTKLLRLARIKDVFKRQEDVLLPFLSSFKLIGVISGMLLVSHFFCCMWYMVGDDVKDEEGKVITKGWISHFTLKENWTNETQL